MIFPSNNSSMVVKYFIQTRPDLVGWCLNPLRGGYKKPYNNSMVYVVDNGAYDCWIKKQEFDGDAFILLLDKVERHSVPPLFVVVPDSVGDHLETLSLWKAWYPYLSKSFRCAFVAQDGCHWLDVPKEASAVFVGGTTDWKLKNAHTFKRCGKWLHIGRVNTKKRLVWAQECGADSVDGSGFMRGNMAQFTAFMEHCMQ